MDLLEIMSLTPKTGFMTLDGTLNEELLDLRLDLTKLSLNLSANFDLFS